MQGVWIKQVNSFQFSDAGLASSRFSFLFSPLFSVTSVTSANFVLKDFSSRIHFEIARRLSQNRGAIRKWILQAQIYIPRTTILSPAIRFSPSTSLFSGFTRLFST